MNSDFRKWLSHPDIPTLRHQAVPATPTPAHRYCIRQPARQLRRAAGGDVAGRHAGRRQVGGRGIQGTTVTTKKVPDTEEATPGTSGVNPRPLAELRGSPKVRRGLYWK